MRHLRGSAPFAPACEGAEERGTPAVSALRVAGLAMIAGGLASCGGDGGVTSGSVGILGDPSASSTYEVVGSGQVVARLRVKAPQARSFFLRGTIPVPKGTVMADGTGVQLAVRTLDGQSRAVTQVEVVSRYPDEDDGADVVEVIAHVDRPETVAVGTELEYDVLFDPHAEEAFELSSDVDAVVSAPGAVSLVSKDPFGHEYKVDLFAKIRAGADDLHMVRDGALIREVRVPEVMLPVTEVEGAQGTLPHMMGVTAFVRTFARQDFFAIDLHVHNGFDGMDPTTSTDDEILDLYFESLELELPQGWRVTHQVEEPFNGREVNVGNVAKAPILAPLANGKMHLMHRQSQFVRRIMISRESAMAEARSEHGHQNLAFCVEGTGPGGDELWSWWNEETARFMPQNHRLASLEDMTSRAAADGEFAAKLNHRLNQVRSGAGSNHPVASGNLGWAHPFGVAYGGMTGGERIDQIPGSLVAWAGSQDGYRFCELRSKMLTERQPYVLYNSSGMPTRLEDHLRTQGNSNGPWLPFGLQMTLGWNQNYFFQNPVTFQANYVQQNGLQPPYEGDLRSYMAIDLQHLIRYTGDLLTLTWLGNDSLAQWQMLQTAELFRMTHHEGYTGTGDFVNSTSLRAKLIRVAEHPESGVDYRRGEAWGLFTTAAAYAVGDDAFRDRMRPWFETVARTVRQGQSACTGNIMASFIHGYGDGTMLTRQAFEVSFVVNALESMRTTVFADKDPEVADILRSTVVECAYSTIRAPFWDDAFGGLRNVTAVGMKDGSIPDFCANLPQDAGYGSTTVERQSPLTVWAFAYELTEDPAFLHHAGLSIGTTANLEAELNIFGPNKLVHSAFLLGKVQRMSVSQ